MSARKEDRKESEQVRAARKWIDNVTKDRPEPRFGARRTRKPRRPADVPSVQRRFAFEDGEMQE